MNFPYRYIARLIIEAKTPLAVGTDTLLSDQDSPVHVDFNGLPMIPGTAITGFLTRKLDAVYFGETFEEADKNNLGSNIIISDALLYDGTKVNQTLAALPESDFYRKFLNRHLNILRYRLSRTRRQVSNKV